jgi:serine phosphatase RsbU (regulator of sigma subunit)
MKVPPSQSEQVNHFLFRLAHRIRPELVEMNIQRQMVGVGDVLITLLIAPLAMIGLIWLTAITQWTIFRQEWFPLLLFGLLLILFNRVNYFFIIEVRADRYGSAEGSLASMIQWSAAFLFGPSALWLSIIYTLLIFFWNWRKSLPSSTRWSRLRSFTQEISVGTLAYLVGLSVYTSLGGTYPLPNLSPGIILIAIIALFIHFLAILIIYLPFNAYSIWVQITLTQSTVVGHIVRFLILALGLPMLANPFSILVAGLYVQDGVVVDLFFIFGLLMVAYMGRQLSWAAETSRQQSRQLEKLENLGRDIINAPPDQSTLPSILAEHVPAMFPSARIAVWMASEGYLLKHPSDWRIDIESVWSWIATKSTPHAFLANNELPWSVKANRHDPIVLTPILSVDDSQPIGSVYIELRSLAQPWDQRALIGLFSGLQSLADSIASALYQAEVYADTLEYQSALQELEFAGRIQASFLPNELPLLNGWELAVSFLPARETAGDFFDFIPLPENKVGILIADVADKGLGAALYMALSRTLIRTYALEFEASPDIVFFSANERVLQDARANLFVTAFYGILDSDSGILTYCNAGHSSPLLLSRKNGGTIHALTPTGMPIGIDEDSTWTQAEILIEPGDLLVLYTDGIPDAQNSAGDFFKERRLIEVLQGGLNTHAQEIQSSILDAVKGFSAGNSQFDDITLLVLKRDPELDIPLQRDSPFDSTGEELF